jgi:histone-lysine N-methyltransferase SETMAR
VLTAEQAERRVKFCCKLLQLPKDHRFIKRIVTCNEKWIYLNNLNLQKQWFDIRQLPVPVAKRERFEKKVLLCVWWNYKGLIYYELVPDGHTINKEVYSQQLEKIYMVLLEKYPALVNRKRVLLRQDNTRPHTVKKTLQKIEELESTELLLHPTFSPDLEPSDYYLFRSMALFLHGKKFHSVTDMEAAVEEFLASKDKEWFYRAFKELAEKWVKTIEHEGLYFVY